MHIASTLLYAILAVVTVPIFQERGGRLDGSGLAIVISYISTLIYQKLNGSSDGPSAIAIQALPQLRRLVLETGCQTF